MTDTERKNVGQDAPAAPRHQDKTPAEDPLDYMLRVMRDETAVPRRRDAMARAAARLMSAQRAASPADKTPEKKALSGNELARRIAFLLDGRKRGRRKP